MGDKGRQAPREGGHTIQPRQEGAQWETKGNNGKQRETKGDKSSGKANSPSNKEKQERVQ